MTEQAPSRADTTASASSWCLAAFSSQQGGVLALASDAGTLAVFSLVQQRCLSHRHAADHTAEAAGAAPIRRLAFSPDGKLLASIGDDKAVRVWSSDADWACVGAQRGPKKLTCLAWADAGSRVLIGDKVGDVLGFALPLAEPTSLAAAAAGSGKRARGAAASADVAEAAAHAAEQLIDDHLVIGHCSVLTDICVSQDACFLLSADIDTHIRVSRYPDAYDIAGYLSGHVSFVSSVAELPNQRIISCGGDGSIRLWSLSSMSQLACVYPWRSPSSVSESAADAVPSLVLGSACGGYVVGLARNSNRLVVLRVASDPPALEPAGEHVASGACRHAVFSGPDHLLLITDDGVFCLLVDRASCSVASTDTPACLADPPRAEDALATPGVVVSSDNHDTSAPPVSGTGARKRRAGELDDARRGDHHPLGFLPPTWDDFGGNGCLLEFPAAKEDAPTSLHHRETNQMAQNERKKKRDQRRRKGGAAAAGPETSDTS